MERLFQLYKYFLLASVGFASGVFAMAIGDSQAAESRAKPFEVLIQSNVVAQCGFGFDNPRIAIAWLQVIDGTLTGAQYISLMQDIAIAAGNPLSQERLAKMQQLVRECIDGDPA